MIGARSDLPSDVADLLLEAERDTKENTGLTLVVAFNYGARQEIAAAARALAEEVLEGGFLLSEIDAGAIASRLHTADIPDPDLIIRTSGEQRLSNFLALAGGLRRIRVFADQLAGFRQGRVRGGDQRLFASRSSFRTARLRRVQREDRFMNEADRDARRRSGSGRSRAEATGASFESEVGWIWRSRSARGLRGWC